MVFLRYLGHCTSVNQITSQLFAELPVLLDFWVPGDQTSGQGVRLTGLQGLDKDAGQFLIYGVAGNYLLRRCEIMVPSPNN